MTTANESYRENLEFTEELVSSFPRSKSPLKAIRRKCLDCTVGKPGVVNDCEITSCALWPFRFGRNPFHGQGAAPEPDTEDV